MSIEKTIITKGIYLDKELRLLVSFDEKDRPVDIVNLDATTVGSLHTATVEKVLKDIDASILVFENGKKGFIENKKLYSEDFICRHSLEKKVCQGDSFNVMISQDPKGPKPASCVFVKKDEQVHGDFFQYYCAHYLDENVEIISDLPEIFEFNNSIRPYTDDTISLWHLYDITKILDRALSKVVHLKNGGNLVIESTEALTVIDINSGKNYGKGSVLETNLLAAEMIARQIRLRSISGIIIIDFLKVNKEEQEQIIGTFKKASNTDTSKVAVHGFTRLGLLEVTRSRMLSPISATIGCENP